jgi:hypothetical protein
MTSWFKDIFSFSKKKKSENLYDHLDWDKIISETSESNKKRREAFYYIYEIYQDLQDAIKDDDNNDKIKGIEKSFDIVNKTNNAIYNLLHIKKEETSVDSICRKFEFNLAKGKNDSSSRENFIFFIIFIKQLILILNLVNDIISSLKNPINIDEYKGQNKESITKMDNLLDNIKKIHTKLKTQTSCKLLVDTFDE